MINKVISQTTTTAKSLLLTGCLSTIQSCFTWNQTPNYIITIIIIIIMSCHRHGYPRPSLSTPPYRSLPLAGLQGYIPYPHTAALCMFELVVLLLLSHMWGSIAMINKVISQTTTTAKSLLLTGCLSTIQSCFTWNQTPSYIITSMTFSIGLFLTVLLECLVLRKIFDWVQTHQGPILALVYPWYTNT